MKSIADSAKEFLLSAKQPLIVVLGPTASGKTDLSIALAEALAREGARPEVVNADSRQLYKHLDIGTAKIRPEEMRGIPHHLLDVTDPREGVSIAWYKEHALTTIDALQMAGKVPLLVGGSMLYISALIDGLEPLPAADPALRRALEEEYDQDAGRSLYARLRELDPVVAAGIDHKNKRYLVRALEIIEQTGIPLTQQRKVSACPYDLLVLGLSWPRPDLTHRIDMRTNALLDSGWIDEVNRLRSMGYTAADPGMQSHGYRELLDWIERGADAQELPAVREKIAQNTRQYAKRQMTWWKSDPRIRWIDGQDALSGLR